MNEETLSKLYCVETTASKEQSDVAQEENEFNANVKCNRCDGVKAG